MFLRGGAQPYAASPYNRPMDSSTPSGDLSLFPPASHSAFDAAFDSMKQQPLEFAKLALLRAVIAVINHLLKSEGAARAQLLPHSGKAISLTLTGIPAAELLPAMRLGIEGGGLFGEALPDAPAALQLSVDAARAMQLAAEGRSVMGAAQISGDAELAAAVGWLAANLRWEFEEDLSRLTGNIVAYNLANKLSVVAAAIKQTATKTEAMIMRGLAEEGAVLTTHAHFAGLTHPLREMRDGVARAEQRLALLEAAARHRPAV